MDPNETGEHGAGSSAEPGTSGSQPPAVSPAPAQPVEPGTRRSGVFLATMAAGLFGAILTMLMLGRPAVPAAPEAVEASVTPAADAAPEPAATPAASVPKWSRANQHRWVSNHRQSVAFELPAENTVAVWMDRVRPSLVVRCLTRGVDVFVVTDTAAAIEPQDDDHTVRIAFDAGTAAEERWPDSVHHDALFAPDGTAFAKRLAGARTLHFGFTPHNGAPVTAMFDLTGVDRVVETVSRTCGTR